MMFRRILVPLDGSSRTEEAVPVAAQIARSSNSCHVLLTRTYSLPAHERLTQAAQTLMSGAPDALGALDPYRLAIEGNLCEVAGWPTLSGIPTETELLCGSSTHAIAMSAVGHRCDLIVLTKRSGLGFSSWATWRVTDYLVRHAAAPVLALSEDNTILTDPQCDSTEPFRVLAPVDGSLSAEAALEPAIRLGTTLTGSRSLALTLALVLTPAQASLANMPEALVMAGAQAYLRRLARRLDARTRHVAVTWQIWVDRDVSHAILASAERVAQANGSGSEGVSGSGHFDLLAMARHISPRTSRHGALNRWAEGGFQGLPGVWGIESITERVLHRSSLPLLIVPTPETVGLAGIHTARDSVVGDGLSLPMPASTPVAH